VSFLAELKRRKVIRAAVAYAVAAWIVLQISDVLVPALNLPEWVVRLVTLLLLLGFPLTLVLAWIIEPKPAFSATTVPAPLPATGIPTAGPSLAVLPFVDLSQARDQEYFADGLAEELLNALAKSAELRVIARTSSFAFKGKQATVSDIARTLGVTHVLEGSVRKAQNRLRINAQLVRVADSSNVWSQSFDRAETDVFAIQDEIAQAVSRELRRSLLVPAGDVPAVARVDPRHGQAIGSEAYDLYLRGRYLVERRTMEGYARAIEALREVVRLVPDFAPAWAALGWAYLRPADHGLTPRAIGFEAGRQAAQQALAIDPASVEAHTVLAWIHLAYDWDWRLTRQSIERALSLDAAHPEALVTLGTLEYTLARHAEALRVFESALAHDPLRPMTHHFMGRNLTNAGKFAQAAAAFRRECQLDPGRGAAHFFLARVLLYDGRLDEAVRELEQEKESVWALTGQAMCSFTAGDAARSSALLEQVIREFGEPAAYQLGEAYAWRGDVDEAFKWLEIAYRCRDGGLLDIVGAPSVRSLVSDLRYADLMRRLDLPLYPQNQL
jgi:TolB-like protein/cytochrome c-type biogenesis protein CcmH/NrfG